MPDVDINFGGSLGLDFRNDDVTCNPRISRILRSLLNLFLIVDLELRKCDSSAFLHYLSYTRRVVAKVKKNPLSS